MNLSTAWVSVFADNNISAVHWSSIGRADAPDVEIMTYAKVNNYAVFTHDLDFSAILAINNYNKPSVIQVRIGDISPAVSARLIINALKTVAAEVEKGALITIDLNKTRLRILPLAGDNFMN
jgi:predicted nuclease of predicted toxin-antitoxin system